MTIFTVGYERRALPDFIADLQRNDVRLLADVRDKPISRKPGFSKSALAGALALAGIGYHHFRALGCPKPIRDAWREDGDWDRYTRDYLAHLARQHAAITELADLTAAQPTALLCYEADFNRCHRTYVARAIAARSTAEVMHITATGLMQDSVP